MDWTNGQRQAIETREKNMLVAAAAGSGKTAVLVQRIFDVITQSTDVDRLLVVTFTKAAAKEMSARLYNKLSDAMKSDELDDMKKERIMREIILLSKSNITTIHSFCQKIIKGNFKESGVDPSATVSDDKETEILKQESLDNVFEKYYQQYSHSFQRLLDTYGSYNSDRSLRECVLLVDKIAASCVNPSQWLTCQADTFDVDKINDFIDTKWAAELIKTTSVAIDAYCDEYNRLIDYALANGADMYADCLRSDLAGVQRFGNILASNVQTWKSLFEASGAISFVKAPTLSSKMKSNMPPACVDACEYVKTQRTSIKEKIVKLIKTTFGPDSSIPTDDMKLLCGDMSTLVQLVIDYRNEYKAQKKKNNILDFDDLEHIAYETLVNNPDVAEYYRNLFDEIYVDEYQDTSEIQEAILTFVSRQQHNMFMVGDVKQSIYSFRQARPDIFVSKYRKYAKATSADKDLLILLSNNFRSSRGVIDSVNHVFSNIMNDITCEMDYSQAEYLYCGALLYDNKDDKNPVEIHVIPKDNPVSEPVFVAKQIKELVDSKYQIMDLKTGNTRDITYADIVILLRSFSKKAPDYAAALTAIGIPVYYQEDSGFFDCGEINVLMSFLHVIDNPLQDLHFISVMRNIYGFTDSELARVKIFFTDKIGEDGLEKGSQFFFEAVKAYAEGENGTDGYLKNKLNVFLDRLSKIIQQSAGMNVSELLWLIMHENDFYNTLMQSQDASAYRGNINVLLNRAINYDKGTNKGLYRFLTYYDNLKKRNIDISGGGYSAGGNNVNIVSVHKSKGLEFPVVFLCDTGKEFNFMDIRKRLVVHRNLGLGPTCYDDDKRVTYPSIMKECIKLRYDYDIRAEEMRILYVAMTRAKDKLIITGRTSNTFENFIMESKGKCSSITGKPLNYHIMRASRFLDWISMCYASEDSKIKINCVKSLDDTDLLVNETDRDDTREDGEEPNIHISFLPCMPEYTGIKETDNIQENEHQKMLPTKVSVTEIKRLLDAFENEDTVIIPEAQIEMHEIEKVFSTKEHIGNSVKNQGTLLHLCLQMLDYKQVEIIKSEADPKKSAMDYTDALVLELEDRQLITHEEANSIDRYVIVQYILSDFAGRLAASEQMIREKPFTMNTEIGGQRVTVQGIIDCIIQEGDKLILIDFKSDFVDPHPDINKLRLHADRYNIQMETYATCLKELTGKEPEKLIYYLRHGQCVDMNE